MRRPNLALVVWLHFMLWYILLRMRVCFVVFVFFFSVLSQEIGSEEHRRNDLFCVGWDVKPYLNPQSRVCQSVRREIMGCN